MREVGRPARRRRPSDFASRRVLCAAIALVAGFVYATGATGQTGAAGRAAEPIPQPRDTSSDPCVRALEVGAGFGDYSGDLGRADGAYVRFTLTKPWRRSLSFDVGRESRFDEESYGFGVTYTHFRSQRTNFSFGVSSGTNEILAPQYRFGASVTTMLAGLVTTIGILRVQSWDENRSDGLSLGLTRYTPHWIFTAFGRGDIGQPGEMLSSSAGLGITYYTWKRTYIGASAEFGDVSYMLFSADWVEVGFYSRSFSLGLSQWFTSRSGANVRATYGDTSFYDVRGIAVSVFQEW